MTPLEIKFAVRKAAKDQDANSALRLCREIAEKDLFIGEPARPTGDERLLEATKWQVRCGGCGKNIPKNSRIYWGKNAGGWHEECYEAASN